MIPTADLKSIAHARLNDAKVLLKGDGSMVRFICAVTPSRWRSKLDCVVRLSGVVFPETGAEFQGLQSIKTHNLEILLRLSGVEGKIKTRFIREWSLVLDWDPEKRYQTSGKFTEQQAKDMIAAVTKLLGVL